MDGYQNRRWTSPFKIKFNIKGKQMSPVSKLKVLKHVFTNVIFNPYPANTESD